LTSFYKINKNESGFTLMEMLIAVAVFSVVITVSLDLYFVAQKAQHKTTAIQRVQSDARYSIEAMAREIRTDKIDYSMAIGNPSSSLSLVDVDGQSIVFRKIDDETIAGCSLVPCIGLKVGSSGSWLKLTPEKIKVIDLKFFIYPTTDPFATGVIGEQPRVTILLTVQNQPSATVADQDARSITLQTTVSSRYYGK